MRTTIVVKKIVCVLCATALATTAVPAAWGSTATGAGTTSAAAAATSEQATTQPETPAQGKLDTTITVPSTKLSPASFKKNLTSKVTVCPAYGRVVSLQRYNADAKKWVTVASAKTAETYTSTVKLKLDSNWKHRYKTSYRITTPAVDGTGSSYCPADEPSAEELASRGAKRARSEKITVAYSPVVASSAVVIDAETKAIVYEKYARKQRKVASITKLMTAILLTEKYSLAHKVTVTKEAAKTPWGIGLKKGEKMSVENLLYAMMLPSANDAATASGIAVSGSTAKFTKKMTERAATLGCANTVYSNAHGLDTKSNHSTAYDQALVGAYIMTSKSTAEIRKVANTKMRTVTSAAGRRYYLESTDKLLGKSGFVGLKTGTTDDAGECFCGAFTADDGRLYISVVLGSKGGKRFDDSLALAKLTSYLQS